MVLNNKDLKLALRDAREQCPNENVKNILSRDNILLIDVFYGNDGIKNILKKSLTLMSDWTDSTGKEVKRTFEKYINMEHRTIN